MAVDWLVTINAIRGYLAKARQAQEQFDDASKMMKDAAADLCSIWKGDAADAFAQEQGVFEGWCSQMSGLGLDYMDVLEKAINVYEKAESAVKTLISSN